MSSIPHVVKATPRGGRVLEVVFDNGVRRIVDLTELLTGPMFAAVREPEFFAQVAIDPGSRTVVWPNGADLAPEALLALPDVPGRQGRQSRPPT